MYDEKWFWGLVTLRGTKCCAKLGLEQSSFRAYHRSHINKVMAIAFTSYAFENTIEDGGVSEKLLFVRAKGKKVAVKTQRVGVQKLDGTIKYDGEIVRRKGDVYDVDCAVTGTNEGAVDDPKCPLLPILRTLFSQW